MRYDEVLQRPKLPHDVVRVILAIDPGFVDPTIIQVIGRDKQGIYRTYIRYRLTRIDFNEQQKIIHWLTEFYHVDQIALDVGSGGNGSAMMHNLMYADEYKGKGYDKRIIAIQFAQKVLSGYTEDGEELFQEAKAFAATELANTIQQGILRFSEVDNEGLSQMERIAKKKSVNGRDLYFVLSDKGNGADTDDHIFASYICYALAIREEPFLQVQRKLAQPRGIHT